MIWLCSSLRGTSDTFQALLNIECEADSLATPSIDLERGLMCQMLSASSSLVLVSGKMYWQYWNDIHPNRRRRRKFLNRKQAIKAVGNGGTRSSTAGRFTATPSTSGGGGTNRLTCKAESFFSGVIN